MTTIDDYMSSLRVGPDQSSLTERLVRRADGTTEPAIGANSPELFAHGNPDTLFGASPSYYTIKKERPEHRLMLWLRLKGHKPAEIANLLRVEVTTVRRVEKQLWFQEAFIRLSSEIGRDSVETFLEGEVLNSCTVIANLRDTAESEAVRLAAATQILDRVKGKPVARVETKSTGNLDVTVYDAAKLMDEHRRNTETLKSRGLSGAN